MEAASCRLLFFTCTALLQAMLFWTFARSQEPRNHLRLRVIINAHCPLQPSFCGSAVCVCYGFLFASLIERWLMNIFAGFLSIDCGSDSASTDIDGIEWVPDTNLINVGTPRSVSGGSNSLLATMRLFDGNQSKYCYSLTNSAVEAGAFFLIRIGIWAGVTPPYAPKDAADRLIKFKMIVDANEWLDVSIPYGTTDWWSFDMYTRAQRPSIDVCLARSTPDGDAPFLSTLELRPLPSTITAAPTMNSLNVILVCLGHADYGVPADSGVFYTRWISCKEINLTIIARARKDAIETVCALEEHFPTSILNIQVHLLVHLVDEVEIASTVHARWMFFLERFMKTLKGFVRQRARSEGSMAEGWIVQDSCVFISEYLTRSQNNIIELWNIKDDERVVSEVPQGNGVVKRFSEVERTKVSDYCMMNTDIMQRWYEMYEQMRQQKIRAREEWRHTSRSVSYPDTLRLPSKSMSASWLLAKIASSKANGEVISPDEQEYAFGPDWHVSTRTLLVVLCKS
ncbi:hypothetical protein L7F22_040610 [Adiantum nelumboides]|nr:hypothetical protein [Adiantum nelumboides]